MAESDLTDFLDFVATTGAAIMSSPEDVINDGQIRNYRALNRMSLGRDAAETIQGGLIFKDIIQLATSGTASTFKPGDQMSYTNKNIAKVWQIPMRYIRNYWEANIFELQRNGEGGSSGSRDMGRFQQFKKLVKLKKQDCYVDLLNKQEALSWATPSNDNMETTAGQEPYSILCFVTGDATATHTPQGGAAYTVGTAPSGFTTVAGLNPTTNTGWGNQYETYDYADWEDAATGLLKGFRRMYRKLDFQMPPTQKEYFESPEARRKVVCTDLQGSEMYERALATSNDFTRVAANDPAYVQAVFAGLPVEYVAQLDAQAWSAGQPNYLWLDFNYIKMVYSRDWFMKPMVDNRNGGMIVDPNRPDTQVCPVATVSNIFCKSRARQGYLKAA